MADNFGLKIGIDGEKEFKNSLRDINQSFKVLGSEMPSSINPLMHKRRRFRLLKVRYKMPPIALARMTREHRTGLFNSTMPRHS